MKISVSNFKKIRSVRAALIHADGRRDRKMDGLDQVNRRFARVYANAPKTAK